MNQNTEAMNEHYIALAYRMDGAQRDTYLDLIAHTMAELAKAGVSPNRIMTDEVQGFLATCVSNNIKVKLQYEP